MAGPCGTHSQPDADPGSALHSGIGAKLCPPSRDSSTSTDVAPVAVHAICTGVWTKNLSPPAGVVSETVSGAAAIVMVTVATLLEYLRPWSTSSNARNVNASWPAAAGLAV